MRTNRSAGPISFLFKYNADYSFTQWISFNYRQTDIANSTHTIIVYRPRDCRTLLTGCSLTLPLPRPHLPPSACLGWVGRSSGPQTARPSLGQAGWRPHRRVSLPSRETVRELPDQSQKFDLEVTDNVTGQVKVRMFDFSDLVASASTIRCSAQTKPMNRHEYKCH